MPSLQEPRFDMHLQPVSKNRQASCIQAPGLFFILSDDDDDKSTDHTISNRSLVTLSDPDLAADSFLSSQHGHNANRVSRIAV